MLSKMIGLFISKSNLKYTNTIHSTMAFAYAHSLTILLALTSLLITTCATHSLVHRTFDQIYQFGDSISDTGNLIRLSPLGASTPAARFPYGETFFNMPTGRWSNGLLIVDYIAMSLKLFPIDNYVAKTNSSYNGVNFAVAGSTALNTSFFTERGILVAPDNTPLSTQLTWFKTVLNTSCISKAECERRVQRSLILLGEIGGNDINYALLQGKSIQEIKAFVPDITNAITNAIREVIGLGALRVVVPGNFKLGCFPFILTALPSSDPSAYDDMGCLRSLNELALFQNSNLQRALASLRLEFPQAIILYADYYTAFDSVVRRAPLLGFNQTELLKSCCGVGGKYNYDRTRFCGSPGVPLCPNPAKYIFWDGLHLTQEANRRITDILFPTMLF